MSDKKTDINMDIDQMKAMARYELTFDQLARKDGLNVRNLVFPDHYRFTLEDLCAALKNIVIRDPTVLEFGESWYHPLMTLSDAFCIKEACGEGADAGDGNVGRYSGLPLSEAEIFESIWYGLEDIWSESDDDARIGEMPEMGQYIKEAETFFLNKGRPVEEMKFTDVQKERFIEQFFDESRADKASESELKLCRGFTDELCAKDSATALELKGYACYGGNRLYKCDWNVSRDCMIRLYEMTDDPRYANTLGYIYYYGRCSGGVPEYEKAFEMFTVSAANGLHEGMYKLADMFLHGYACKKSASTARKLYGFVYDDCYGQFLEGKDDSFADAALRMGNVFSRGIAESEDPQSAYYYYLQADLAARRRAEKNSFFGDTNVIIGIRKAIDETKKKLPDGYFKDYLSMDYPLLFDIFCENGYHAEINVKIIDGAKADVWLRRLPRRGQTRAKPFLFTVPSIDYCCLITEIRLAAFGMRTSAADARDISFRYDSCEWNESERRIDFYCGDELSAWIACDEYRFYNENTSGSAGRLLTFVSVVFYQGGRTYDYLCDIDGVTPGDRLIVSGYDGETEVVVQSVFTKYESELGIPAERYKKIIRKA